jgi:hypothetical protein
LTDGANTIAPATNFDNAPGHAPGKARFHTRGGNRGPCVHTSDPCTTLAWQDVLPDTLRDTATAEDLQAIVDLDLDPLTAIVPPRGYGRD